MNRQSAVAVEIIWLPTVDCQSGVKRRRAFAAITPSAVIGRGKIEDLGMTLRTAAAGDISQQALGPTLAGDRGQAAVSSGQIVMFPSKRSPATCCPLPAASPWYPIAAMRRGRVAVRVQWNARAFTAIRLLHPKEKRWRWATYRSGEVVWLPPRRRAHEWGSEPQCWQPLDAAAWSDPLPNPIAGPNMRTAEPPGSGRFIASQPALGRPPGPRVQPQRCPRAGRDRGPARLPTEEPGRGRRIAQAEAADRIRAEIDAEIGLDPEPAHAPAADDSAPDRTCGQSATGGAAWWRDPAAIRFEPEGRVSLPMAEGRVMRALAAAGRGNVLVRRQRDSTLGRLADAVAAALDRAADEAAGDAPAAIAARFEPTPRDADDWLGAMAWFTALNPPELRPPRAAPWSFNRLQQILVWRAMTPPLSWVRISRHIGRSRTRAGQLYVEAVDKVWRAANGLPVYRHAAIADQIALLRSRNRAHLSSGGRL